MKKILGLIIGLGVPAVVGMEMLSNQIISVIADKSFGSASLTMRLLAPIVLLNACANVLYYDILVPYGKENKVLFCTAMGAIINLIVSMALIPLYQENGAAIGSVIAEIASLAAAVIFCNKVDRQFLSKMPCIRNYLIGGAVIAAWCLLCLKIIYNTFLLLLTAIFGSVILYFIILILLKDFIGKEIITQVKNILKKIFAFKR